MEITLTGSGFLFRNGGEDENPRPLSGMVTGFTLRFDGDVVMTITDLMTALTDFDHLMFGWSGFNMPFPPDGVQILSVMLARNDTIMGSAKNSFLIQGLNGGNDVIYGGDGSDSIFAGAGSDTIFGGNGDDIYTLADTALNGTGYRGAVVNLADGRAIDSWGGRDRLDSIEQVIGSRLSDRVIGSDRDETIVG